MHPEKIFPNETHVGFNGKMHGVDFFLTWGGGNIIHHMIFQTQWRNIWGWVHSIFVGGVGGGKVKKYNAISLFFWGLGFPGWVGHDFISAKVESPTPPSTHTPYRPPWIHCIFKERFGNKGLFWGSYRGRSHLPRQVHHQYGVISAGQWAGPLPPYAT